MTRSIDREGAFSYDNTGNAGTDPAVKKRK
jgi:hypothetical protein